MAVRGSAPRGAATGIDHAYEPFRGSPNGTGSAGTLSGGEQRMLLAKFPRGTPKPSLPTMSLGRAPIIVDTVFEASSAADGVTMVLIGQFILRVESRPMRHPDARIRGLVGAERGRARKSSTATSASRPTQ
jgi:ABC-type branched-subunit amino acid transport system ATPase component